MCEVNKEWTGGQLLITDKSEEVGEVKTIQLKYLLELVNTM